VPDPPTPPLSAARVRLAAALLGVVRGIVAARITRGPEDAGVDLGEVEQRAAGDAEATARLDAAVEAAQTPDMRWLTPEPPGVRERRAARTHEVREALGLLLLAGDLAADGPERHALPGWGASTWRAVAVLVRSGDAAAHPWEAAVARLPLADLGPGAPAPLHGLRAPPALEVPARRLLAAEAERQDLRHGLLTAATRLAAALDRGVHDAAAALADDCAQLSARIDLLDRMSALLWEDGAARARGGRARPGRRGT